MADLIQDLEADHVTLLEMLQHARELDVTSTEGREMLLRLKGLLIAHLRKEDLFFYPVLKNGAIEDKHLQALLGSFAEDMALISRTAIAFFDKYRENGGRAGFAEELDRLHALFVARYEREEKILYPEFRKIQERTGAGRG